MLNYFATAEISTKLNKSVTYQKIEETKWSWNNIWGNIRFYAEVWILRCFVLFKKRLCDSNFQKRFSFLKMLFSILLLFEYILLVIQVFSYFAWTSNEGITVLDITEQAVEGVQYGIHVLSTPDVRLCEIPIHSCANVKSK